MTLAGVQNIAIHKTLYLHIGQGGAKVFINVGFQYWIKMLKLDISNQGNNKYLIKTRIFFKIHKWFDLAKQACYI